jgi:hypothetical protein
MVAVVAAVDAAAITILLFLLFTPLSLDVVAPLAVLP